MWIPATTTVPDEEVALLQQHLLDEMIDCVPDYPTDQLSQMARGVAAYCAPLSRQGIPTTALNGHVARALWSVGAHESARQWLETRVREGTVRATLTALIQLKQVPAWMWRVATAGVLVYRDDWPSGGECGLWALDVYRIHDWSHQLYLAQMMMVRTLLTALEPFWCHTDGQGTLGVRPARREDKEAPEWAGFCRDALRVAQKRHGWSYVPEVWRLPAAEGCGCARRWEAEEA